MKTYEECLSCFVRHACDICDMAKLSRKATQRVTESVRTKIASFPRTHSPVRMASEINSLIRTESGIADPYADLKKAINLGCRTCLPLIAEAMILSPDPIRTAIRLAIAGNIIDCGTHTAETERTRDLPCVVRQTLLDPLLGSSVEEFIDLINHARRVLYIGDNAGECFFDSPLLELIPSNSLVYAVRGGPVLNDATVEDAHAAGIQNRCRIIDTGDDAPGIILDRCSDEFRRLFRKSDLIISKGQGNYESLSGTENKTIVYLTKVKCGVVAREIGYPVGSSVVKISRGNHRSVDTKKKADIRHV